MSVIMVKLVKSSESPSYAKRFLKGQDPWPGVTAGCVSSIPCMKIFERVNLGGS
jgi:hypothetical protein